MSHKYNSLYSIRKNLPTTVEECDEALEVLDKIYKQTGRASSLFELVTKSRSALSSMSKEEMEEYHKFLDRQEKAKKENMR
jgi:uncharacterized protein YqeY